jgi:hypothetical protein
MTTTLREIIASHLDDVVPPTADLARVTRMGRSVRRRRTGAFAGAAAVTVTAVGLTTAQLAGNGTPSHGANDPTRQGYRTVAAYDIAQGLRAFADPAADGKINLGDKTYSRKGMEYLDTDASATPYGMVFFDKDQKPRLLADDGKVVALGDGPSTPVKNFHPSSKVDSKRPLVGWTENHGDHVRVVVYDVPSRDVVSARDVPCSAKSCAKIKLDALDAGSAFVRTSEGTFIWNVDKDTWDELGGPKLRVADVRSGTILWADQAPTMPHGPWRYVAGKIDAQLTFDGKNVLYWSNRLASTTPGGQEIRLKAGSAHGSWYTFDTDGSVLVAVMTDQDRMTSSVKADVFDCEIPSGSCVTIGHIDTDSGDPMFIGDDM